MLIIKKKSIIMSKRLTVKKILQKRLSDSLYSIQLSRDFQDIGDVYGIDFSENENQHRKNLLKDIKQI